MKIKIFLLLLIVCISANAQDLAAYNKLYVKTYLETAPVDFKKALHIADSLYKTSETPTLQTRSLMLSATLYRDAKDFKTALWYAEKAEAIIENTDNLNWKARTSLFLTSQYRALKLYGQAKKYAEKTLETGQMIKDTLIGHNIQGLIFQEMAGFEQDRKRYRKSIQYVYRSQFHFNNIIKDKDFFAADNEQILGSNFYHLKNMEASLLHYKKALEFARNIPQSKVMGKIYDGLANIYLEKNDLVKAKNYLDLAQKLADKGESFGLKNDVYNTIEKYYLKTRNIEKLKDVELKQDTIEEKITTETRQFIDQAYANLDKKIVKAEKKSIYKSYIILVTGFFVILFLLLYIRSKVQQQKNLVKFKEILRRSGENSRLADSIDIKEIKIEELQAERHVTPVLMTLETEEKLLSKLNKFEKSNLFNNKNISLPLLAGRFETNTKYLSYVINKHKEKDFNNYINELRINYIIEKLKNEPQYRNYKIASLADEVGFSSHSKFTTVFKKVTSLSPSLFLKYLQEETGEE
ncbi:helix-turn-helix domain-containing protein [Chryseobacterium lathyri]|uniref:AraC-like DNA-binding protein n=1 Tax=Chryseobacterium lathyri TaxID=395933 RepID=A0ABT9ST31_9FLAO|nr:AraC family transcriptional regulator [Chryseobacterium lathyri]MDP9962142.1 AraC-like DNA-binding protein [Chryseobacterium lathyri]